MSGHGEASHRNLLIGGLLPFVWAAKSRSSSTVDLGVRCPAFAFGLAWLGM